MNITTKQFQILTDVNLVWDFLKEIYDRETGSCQRLRAGPRGQPAVSSGSWV